MGRWRRESLRCVNDDLFLDVVVAACNRARGPFQHFLARLQQRDDNFEPGRRRVCKLAQLVFFKVDVFYDELVHLLSPDEWGALVVRAPEGQREQLWSCILAIALQHVVDFQHRIRGLCQEYPLKLLWIAYNEPDIQCTRRRDVARELLSANPAALEVNALKLVVLFRPQLRVAAENGRCPTCLYVLIDMWVARLQCDVQAIERANKIVQNVVDLAPNIDLPLLSARLGIMQAVFGRWRSAKTTLKNSEISPIIEVAAQEAVAHYSMVDDVLGNIGRWATPPPEDLIAHAFREVSPSKHSASALAWALQMNLAWYRQHKRASGEQGGCALSGCIVLGTLEDHDAWICPLTYGRSGWLLRVRLAIENGIVTSAPLVQPLEHSSTIDVLCSYYDRLVGPEHIATVRFCDIRLHQKSWALCAPGGLPLHEFPQLAITDEVKSASKTLSLKDAIAKDFGDDMKGALDEDGGAHDAGVPGAIAAKVKKLSPAQLAKAQEKLDEM
eukprot:6390303-Pyramimonas_sp.AAC.1